jgi:hypothetical protein
MWSGHRTPEGCLPWVLGFKQKGRFGGKEYEVWLLGE